MELDGSLLMARLSTGVATVNVIISNSYCACRPVSMKPLIRGASKWNESKCESAFFSVLSCRINNGQLLRTFVKFIN